MKTFIHKCIKCATEYSDEDVDPYLCADCNEKRLVIAKEIDAKIALQGKREQPVSDFQRYNELTKGKGFANIKDLGITL